MQEVIQFVPDDQVYTTPGDKNDRLSDLLAGAFHDRAIVLIERIEIQAQGWRITYRH